MKKIDKWIAQDGSEWKTEQDAFNRDALLEEIYKIESLLPDRPNDTNFSNGRGYIQHSQENVYRVRDWFYELACNTISVLREYDPHQYAFSRYLGDRNSPLVNLYHRLYIYMNESTWREYGQGYFALHPEEAEDINLNGE